MNLRPFQIEGADFLATHRNGMLLDEPGTGKSGQALAAAAHVNAARILCVGPAVAGVSWPIELKKWASPLPFINLSHARHYGLDAPGFYFLSYDVVSAVENLPVTRAYTRCRPWDVLLLDEAQYLKSLGANRTKAIYGFNSAGALVANAGLASNAQRVWLLSGTLTPNHLGESYSHLRRLFPECLARIPNFNGRVPEQHEFEELFCEFRDTHWGRVCEGSKNMKLLRDAIKPAFLRRRKTDVLDQLPPMEFFSTPVALDPDVIEEIWDRELADHALVEYQDLLEMLDGNGQSEAAALQTLLTAAPFSTARRALGLAKAPAVAELVEDRLQAGEHKLIVFGWHKDVLARLHEALAEYDPVLFTGETTEAVRAAAVDRFQHHAGTRVFIGQLQAAGTAITLTAARTVILAEFSGTPGVNYQAASRAHRIGQRDGVQVHFAMVPDSLDERLAGLARRRAADISQLFD